MKQNETDGRERTVPISRRSLLEAMGVAVLAGGALTGPTAATTGSTPTPVLAQLVSQQSEYRGPARTVVLAGDGITTTEQTYERDVVVVVGPPRGAPGQPGHWEIRSALLSGNVLFQFWEYDLHEDGTFDGV